MVIAIWWSVPSYLVLIFLDRHFLKRQRAKVPWQFRRACAARAARSLKAFSVFRSAQRVACYWGTREEFDTERLIRAVQRAGKELYLPVIIDLTAGQMVFQRFDPGARLQVNSFGLFEPEYCEEATTPVASLDLVVAPLLAFDSQGHRMGMGGGFYDRALSSRLQCWRRPKPFYLGLAFELQRRSRLPRRRWDVPLDAILTERGVQRFR